MELNLGGRRKGCKAKRVTRLSRLACISYENRIEIKQLGLRKFVIHSCFDTESTRVEQLESFPACMSYSRADVQGLGTRDKLVTTISRHPHHGSI